MRLNESINDIVKDVGIKIAEETERSILNQLNWLISRDLLEVRIKQPLLVTQSMSLMDNKYHVDVRREVELVLKDKEYIEKLEAENKAMREELEYLATLVKKRANFEVSK